MVSRAFVLLALVCTVALGRAEAADRPYLFTAEEPRLRALIANGDAKADNFLHWMDVVAGDRAAFAYTPGWWLAMAAWLNDDAAMKQLVHAEVMAEVNAHLGGDDGHGDIFLHVHDRMLGIPGCVDLMYDTFSNSERTAIADWVNGTLDNWNEENMGFWPYDDPLNNYWQNGFLAHVIAGIATKGYNPRADEWLAKAGSMYVKFRTACNPPIWNGLVIAEGNGYSNFVDNALWAMDLHDATQGSTWFADSNVDCDRWLDVLRFLTRPDPSRFFHVGSQPGSPWAPVTTVSSTFWHHLIAKAGDTASARYAKAVLEAGLPGNQPERDRTFAEFYWSTSAVATVARSTIPDRMLVAPIPGAGLIGLRSAAGFQPDAIAALVFSNLCGGGGASSGPARFSHAHPDAPGFQWAKGGDWLVTDPDAFTHGGISGEHVGSAFANIVTLAGDPGARDDSLFPQISFAEDRTSGAIPHVYLHIDAQPFWNAASTYRREYVWLDDLRVVAIFDHVVAPQAKTWRLHIPAAATISGSRVDYSIAGNSVTVRDLLASSGSVWASDNLTDDGTTVADVWRLSQTSTASDFRSLKIIDVDGRVASAVLTSGSGWYQADVVIDGMARALRFYDDGTHALITGDGADTSPPAISGVSTSPAATTATISWTTNETADAQVEYGATAAYGASATADEPLGIVHHVELTGLTEATTYHFRVHSTDAAGNAAVSSDNVFTTADATPPVITTPASAAASTTTASLAVAAIDNGGGALSYTWSLASGPAGVIFSGNADTSAGAIATVAHAGTYVFTVTVADPSGNSISASTDGLVFAAVPTTVTIAETAPRVAPGADVHLHATASDQFGDNIAGATIAWSITAGGGTIDPYGIYTAPADSGTATVTASCGAASTEVDVSIRLTADGHDDGHGNDGGGGCGLGGLVGLLAAAVAAGLYRRRGR
ncbi:MAG: fibronectin type III domain-containing protein [Planctomycetes bacterium]|nr:fibronectin type III domain-containing protein [Planctomycetota bacterium]